jgi:hypothetical protein
MITMGGWTYWLMAMAFEFGATSARLALRR